MAMASADFAFLEPDGAPDSSDKPLVVRSMPWDAAFSVRLPARAARHCDRRHCRRHRRHCLLPTSHACVPPACPPQVLMGWVGAQRDGALLKYAELLAAHGYSSVRSVQPTGTAFSPFAGGRRRWALAMLSFLEKQGLWPQRRLVFYAFSNGEQDLVQSFTAGAPAPRLCKQVQPPSLCLPRSPCRRRLCD